MKRIFLVFASLVFAFGVLGTSVASTTAQGGVKYKTNNLSSSPTIAPTSTPMPVNYQLAYPGILPDNFLYSIKMFRDKIIFALTTNPLKKAELSLLYSDKRLGAGKALIEGGKTSLGLSTIEKGEKYLEEAAREMEEASQKKEDVSAFKAKFKTAALKHLEVLEALKTRVPDDVKPTLEGLMKYSQAVEKVTQED